jgi:hypothetical protein
MREITLPRGFFVKIAVVGAAIWLVSSLMEIPSYDTSAKGKLDLVAFSILGAVLIMSVGLGAQWLYHFYLAKTRRRRPGD